MRRLSEVEPRVTCRNFKLRVKDNQLASFTYSRTGILDRDKA
jgi:hypothetical protein